jgi:PqqD family protein of HPr-rel-A system
MITVQSTVSLAPGLTAAHLGDEAVLLDTNSGRYYGLNELGARIFELAKTSTSVQQIMDALLQEYKVEAERLEADLLAFLGEMEERKLIHVTNGNPA